MKESFFFSFMGKIAAQGLLLLLLALPAFGQVHSDSLWPYYKIRADLDNDGTPDHLGEKAIITGIANIQSGILHEHYLQAFIQSDSAGMSIFARKIDTPFEAGDSLVVRGEIQQYNGLVEVNATSYQVYKNEHKLVPSPLSSAIADPKKFLGMLVEGEGNVIEKGSTYNGKFVRISQKNKSGDMMIYVSNFHRLHDDFDFDMLRIGDRISVKGIITEYNPEFPGKRTYKLFLRTPDDLTYATIPQYYQYLIFGSLILGTIFIFIWVIILRQRVRSKTSEIQHSLDEKNILLREIHHRVKNSLSIVSGLLELQHDGTDNKEAQRILQNSQTRIRSIALIHEKLYQTDSIANIQLNNYIQELAATIHETFNNHNKDVELTFDMENVEIDIDRVIPCGLLINELIVNAFKYAFSKVEHGKLHISLKNKDKVIILSLSDNGPGLPDEVDQANNQSLGTMLIHSFVDQLDAEMEVETNGNGTTFLFTIPVVNKKLT